MSAARLSCLLKIGSILVSTLLVSGMAQMSNARILFDRGLPSENINVEPDLERSNLRWRGGYRNESFYGDDFTIGEPGERYIIDHIRTWAVLGYREEGPTAPEAVGDWFSQLRLLGGEVSDTQLAMRASGELAVGGSSTSNPDIIITQVRYPNAGSSKYFNFGPTIPIWQIDFHNLNWLVEGGRRYNFSVQGMGRQFLDTEYSHAWYNHASNAALSGTPQQGADNLMSAFSDTGEFLYIVDAEEDKWNKATDLNIQIFGRAVSGVEGTSNEGQNVSLVEVVHNLNKVGLLTGRTYNRTVREVEQGIIRSRSQVLDKLIEQDRPPGYVAYASLLVLEGPEVDDLSEAQHNVLEQLNNDLEQLNNTGVLSKSVYEYLQREVASGSLAFKSQLYQRAKNQLEREESVDPDMLKPRLDSLRKANILSEEGYTSLIEALEASELKNPIEFLNYIDRAQMFDLNDYSTEPALYFPAIYQSVAQMLSRTGLISGEVSKFDLELIPDQRLNQIYEFLREDAPNLDEESTNRWRSYDALVSGQIDSRQYEQSSYYSTSSNPQDFLGRLEVDGVVNLFNKVLRDQSSAYRLFATQSFDPHVDYSRFGVIALTEAQADVYWKSSSHETYYTSTFTSDRITEIITQLKDIKLLDHLSADKTAEGEKQIARQYITNAHQLLSAFENVVLPLPDWEGAEGEAPYKYLLEDLSDISHGSFEPIDIDDNFDWDNQTAGIAFTLNGTRYSTHLDFNNDWLDPQFFEFVESVVAKEVQTGQFYPLSENGEGYGIEGYIFLNDEQLEDLRSQQLVVLPAE